MLRVRLLAAATIAMGAALAGCSSSGSSDWFKPSPPPPQVTQFESQPPGANVQTASGQTCSTPCALALPVNSQVVSFSLNGYVTQTVPLTVHQPEGSLFSTPPPTLVPSPVIAMLQAAPPPPPPPRKVKERPRRIAAKPRAAAPPPAMAAPTQPSIMAPEPTTPAQDNVFPPPPPESSFPNPLPTR